MFTLVYFSDQGGETTRVSGSLNRARKKGGAAGAGQPQILVVWFSVRDTIFYLQHRFTSAKVVITSPGFASFTQMTF